MKINDHQRGLDNHKSQSGPNRGCGNRNRTSSAAPLHTRAFEPWNKFLTSGARSFVLGPLLLVAPMLASSCSFIVEKHASQCEKTSDCTAKGGEFSGSTCTAGLCVRGCSTNQECLDKDQTSMSICRKKDGTCVALTSQDCPGVLGKEDLKEDNVMVFGSLFSITGDDQSSGLPLQDSVDLARRDLQRTTSGLPSLRPGEKPRPVAVVACDEAKDPVRAARHLVDDVRVPAIFGATFSSATMKVANQVTIPGDVLLISPSSTSPLITNLQDNGLVWRTVPSDTLQAIALAGLLVDLEQEIRDEPGSSVGANGKVRVAVVFRGDTYGTSLGSTLYEKLRFNGGKTPAENGNEYLSRNFGDPSDPNNTNPDALYAATGTELINFQPHVTFIIGATEAVQKIMRVVESGWRTTAYRPRHVFADAGEIPELLEEVGANDNLRARVLGTVPGPGRSNANYQLFQALYTSSIKDGTSGDISGTAGAYDAFYLVAYSAALAGDKSLSGTALAEGLKNMSSGAPVDVGPNGISNAFSLLVQGESINFNGASGPLDFDARTGEASSNIQIWCVSNAGGKPTFQETGRYFDAVSARMSGRRSCP